MVVHSPLSHSTSKINLLLKISLHYGSSVLYLFEEIVSVYFGRYQLRKRGLVPQYAMAHNPLILTIPQSTSERINQSAGKALANKLNSSYHRLFPVLTSIHNYAHLYSTMVFP
ncbi:hypothetical protein I3843_01G225300 [Carya illinoinensis]|nr:hypothetical protein I3843_01G225300 [Carya illinoinensis]